MEYFAGLDVSVKETSVCTVDAGGQIVREANVASEPEALIELSQAWPDAHIQSPMSVHRAMVGNTRPLFRSALGKALLAALPGNERSEIMEWCEPRGAEMRPTSLPWKS